MGLEIRLPGVDYSQYSLPKKIAAVRGFPSLGLQGLYLFEDGANDAAYQASVIDSSGLGNHGVLRSGWGAATKRTYGMQVADPGVSIDLPLNYPTGDFSVIALYKTDAAAQAGASFHCLLAHRDWITTVTTANGLNTATTKTGMILLPRIDVAANNQRSYGFFDPLGLIGPSNNGVRDDTAYMPHPSNYDIVLFSFESSKGQTSINVLNKGIALTQPHTTKVNYASAITGLMNVGLMQYQPSGDAAGKLGAFAYYNKILSTPEIDFVRKAMQKVATERNIILA